MPIEPQLQVQFLKLKSNLCLKASKHLITFKRLLGFIRMQVDSLDSIKVILLNAGPTCPKMSRHVMHVKLASINCELQTKQQLCFNKHFLQHLKSELNTGLIQPLKNNSVVPQILGSSYYAQLYFGELQMLNCRNKQITKIDLTLFVAQVAEKLLNSGDENASRHTTQTPCFELIGGVVMLFGQTLFINSAELKQTLILLSKNTTPEVAGLTACRRILLLSRTGPNMLVKAHRNVKRKFYPTPNFLRPGLPNQRP